MLRKFSGEANVCGHHRAIALVALLALARAGQAHEGTAEDAEGSLPPPDEALEQTAKGHGSVSLAFLDSLADGFLIGDGTNVPNGAVRSYSVVFEVDYYVANNWSIHVGIPYVSNRYQGAAPHCPTTAPPQCQADQIPALNPQHPESQFLDDGDFHSTWQDWTLGAAYHTDVNGFLLSPSLNVYIPSHSYTFFANAAVGQRLWEIEPAIEIAHQFDFTNVYYQVRYGYVLTQHTLGYDVDHHHLDLELGYFFNPKFSARVFTIGKKGNGLQAGEGPDPFAGMTNETWFHHDQISAHNLLEAGIGADYQLDNLYTLSSSVARLVWGETVFNFKYAFELRLTRSF